MINYKTNGKSTIELTNQPKETKKNVTKTATTKTTIGNSRQHAMRWIQTQSKYRRLTAAPTQTSVFGVCVCGSMGVTNVLVGERERERERERASKIHRGYIQLPKWIGLKTRLTTLSGVTKHSGCLYHQRSFYVHRGGFNDLERGSGNQIGLCAFFYVFVCVCEELLEQPTYQMNQSNQCIDCFDVCSKSSNSITTY